MITSGRARHINQSLQVVAEMLPTRLALAAMCGQSDEEAPMTGPHLDRVIGDLSEARVAAEMLAEGISQAVDLFRMEKADTERDD